MKHLVVLLAFVAIPLASATSFAATRPFSAARIDRSDAVYKAYGKASAAHATGTTSSGGPAGARGAVTEIAKNGTRTTTTVSIKDDQRGRTVKATVTLQRPGGRPQVGSVRIDSKLGDSKKWVKISSRPGLPWAKR